MGSQSNGPDGSSKGDAEGEVIFLGTGVSTGLPRIGCVLYNSPRDCKVCKTALANPFDPNNRGNVSILIRRKIVNEEGGVVDKCIMVDAGKTMRQSVLRWFPRHQVSHIDAVILTHGHADAMGGIDDLRDLQKVVASFGEDGEIKEFFIAKELPIYLNEATLACCRGSYPYLMNQPEESKSKAKDVPRRIARLRWTLVENTVPFTVEGVEVIPLPVLHGGSYVSLGFAFGGGRFTYISDVSCIPEEMYAQLAGYDIQVLVMDALATFRNPSHFSLDEALEAIRRLKPKKAFLVGMSCEMGLHHEMNEKLRALLHGEGLDVQLAYDGLSIPMDFSS